MAGLESAGLAVAGLAGSAVGLVKGWWRRRGQLLSTLQLQSQWRGRGRPRCPDWGERLARLAAVRLAAGGLLVVGVTVLLAVLLP